jgi:Tol biopolymer transport system component
MRRLLVAALLLTPLAALTAPVDAAVTRTPKNAVVSVSSTGAAGDYDSGGIADSAANRNEVTMSADGRFVAFHSIAGNLTADDTNNRSSVFVRDRDVDGDKVFDEAGQVSTVLVSRGTNGEQTYGQGSSSPYLSRDGRFVTFESNEALVAEDTNGAGDIYVRDRDTDKDGVYDEAGAVTTSRVSVGPEGQQGNNSSMEPVITPDGRYVVFSSIAATLLPADPDFLQDIYLRDRDTDGDGVFDEPGAVDTQLITQLPGGGHEQTTSAQPTISPDGRFVLWETLAQGWVAGDANRAADIYLRDRDADGDRVLDEPGDLTTTRISVGLGGADTDQESQEAAISDNGRFVTFSSQATNLVTNDTNGVRDIFVVDRDRDKDGIFDEAGATSTKRASVSSTGRQSDGRSVGPTISADGRVIVFESSATNLDVQSGLWGVYLRDRDADRDKVYDEKRGSITTILSLSRSNGPADGSSFTPVVSANRRWVAFTSMAENLVKGQTNNNRTDVFVRGPLG